MAITSPPPDSTLTMTNVIRVMEKVAVDKRGRAWETVLDRHLASNIYGHCYSLEEEKLYTCADIYANCKPDSSWEQVFQGLYEGSEQEAAKEAKAFLQQKGVVTKNWGVVGRRGERETR